MLKPGSSPQAVLDGLHGLLSSLGTLFGIARYYGTPARMTVLFTKITHAMIRLCRESILAPGKLWDQDKPALVASMQVCRGGAPPRSTGAV